MSFYLLWELQYYTTSYFLIGFFFFNPPGETQKYLIQRHEVT